jgi:hypothetical protein
MPSRQTGQVKRAYSKNSIRDRPPISEPTGWCGPFDVAIAADLDPA